MTCTRSSESKLRYYKLNWIIEFFVLTLTSPQLPLIQFTNGGIRFNFAGYHAQAGLGGLLGGSKAGGGLHASAGTPWGANAAAGLGGLLGGDNANAG